MAAMIQAPKLALEIFENVRDDPGLGADGMSHLVPQWLDGFQWKILYIQMDDLGVPLFEETSIIYTIYIYNSIYIYT